MSTRVAAALFFLLLSTASAATHRAPIYRLQRAFSIARTVWPQACWPVSWLPERPAAADANVMGWAWSTWDSSGSTTSCEVWLRGDWVTWPWWELCDGVLHETGHLARQPHSTDPASIMYPVWHPVPECWIA